MHNNPFKAPASWPGPPLHRSFCALIAKNHQHSSGLLTGRYAYKAVSVKNIITIFMLFISLHVSAEPPSSNSSDREEYNLSSVHAAVKMYYLRNGKFPPTLQSLKELKDFDQLNVTLKDGWGNSYVYDPIEYAKSPKSLYSMGKNGVAEKCLGDDICR